MIRFRHFDFFICGVGASQNYSGGYGGGYATPAPQQAGQYGAQGAAGGYNQGNNRQQVEWPCFILVYCL